MRNFEEEFGDSAVTVLELEVLESSPLKAVEMGCKDGRRGSWSFLGARSMLCWILYSSVFVGEGGITFTDSPKTAVRGTAVAPPSLVNDVSVEWEELILKRDGAKE